MADVADALATLLEDFGETFTQTPDDLGDRLPALLITRSGGAGDREHDFPRVTVAAFALVTQDDPRAHFDLADDIEAFLFEKVPGAYVLDRRGRPVLFDDIRKESGPAYVPQPDVPYRGAETTYVFTTRR